MTSQRHTPVLDAVLVKSGHCYIIRWRQGRHGEAVQQTGRWASDPLLDFTWRDAAALAQEIRRQAAQVPQTKPK